MSRRVATTVAVAGLLLGAAVPLASHASPVPCPAWTDNPDDAHFNGGNPQPVPTPLDPNFEIVGFGFAPTADAVRATIGIEKLSPTYIGTGDDVTFNFMVGEASLQILAAREPSGSTVRVSGAGGTGVASVDYQTATNTVVLTVARTELDKANGAPTSGLAAHRFQVATEQRAGGIPLTVWDSASAPETDAFPLSATCGAGGTPVELPVGFPKAGCFTVKDDGTSDARPFNQTPYDPDLDLTGVVLKATDEDVKAFVSVVALGSKPANFYGHGFHVTFTAGADQAVELIADAYDPAALATVAAQRTPTTQVLVNSSPVADSGLTVDWDTAHNVVVLTVPRAKLTAAAPAFVDGSEIKFLTALSAVATGAHDQVVDTTAHDNVTQGDAKWTVGDNACFEVPKGKLLNVGATSAAFSDAAAVAVKLTDSAGKALAGRDLTLALEGREQTVKTGADGVARTALNPGLPAGTYPLTASFAGDSAAGAVELPTTFKVLVEKTRTALTATASGTKRTVVAKLTDDDAKVLAGQVVTWFVNGKKVATSKTTAKGTATLTTAKPGQTVLAQYAGLAGKYAASKASRKV